MFSLPQEPAPIAALLLALILLWPLARALRGPRMPRMLWWLLPLLAALLSWAYVLHYLRGGPRIIDATAYLLQARGLAEGQLSLPLSEPFNSELGRFVVHSAGASEPGYSVIFPPGYPALLALAVRAGAPLLLGPLLAALLVWATMALADTLSDALDTPRWRGCFVAGSGLLSMACAALRYHTADTMAHGAAALWWIGALLLLLKLHRCPAKGRRALWLRLGLGLCIGALGATRPASALALLLTLAIALWQLPRLRPQLGDGRWLVALLGAAPWIGLWLAHQHTATGSLWQTAQGAYYQLSDGPSGCFGYGLGRRYGCQGEHGQFVAKHLAGGYYLNAALGTTARRLFMHASDALNSGALLPLLLAGVWQLRHKRWARLLAVAIGAQVLAYAPFYFDGNYPGGGARMFADVLPLEHVLAAAGALYLAKRIDRLTPAWAISGLVSASLLAFALHKSRDHAALREREGGWPMYQPQHTAQLPEGALLFVDTDHGFNLARALSPQLRPARMHGDGLDRLRWQAAGQPPAYLYDYRVFGPNAGQVRLRERLFSAPQQARIEGESLWPPQLQLDAWVWPRHLPYACVSRGRALRFYPHREGGSVRLRLPSGMRGPVTLTLVGLDGAQSPTKFAFISNIYKNKPRSLQRKLVLPGAGHCQSYVLPAGTLDEAPWLVELSSRHPFALDTLTLGEKVRHNQ